MKNWTNYCLRLSGKSNPEDKGKKIFEYVEEDGYNEIEYRDIRYMAVKSTITLLKTNINELAEIDNKLKELLQHFDYNLTSIRGVSTVLAATIISDLDSLFEVGEETKDLGDSVLYKLRKQKNR